MKRYGTVLLGIGAVLAAAVLGWTGWHLGTRAYAVFDERSWAAAAATVTAAQTISETREHDARKWAPAWTYRYTVNGRAFEGQSAARAKRATLHWAPSEAAAARDALQRPVGAAVTAYYDPADPGSSVLDKASFGSEDALYAAIFVLVIAKILDVVMRASGMETASLLRRRGRGDL